MSQKNIVHKRFSCTETVPAFSVVAITGGVGAYRTGYTVTKPTEDDTAHGATGKASGTSGLLNMGEDLLVRYDGTIAVGDRCRPKPNDWVMEKNSSGKYVCVALYERDSVQLGAFRKDIEQGSLKMFIAPSGGIPGRTGTVMGSAECDVVETNSSGQLTTSTSTITVYNWARFAACKNGDRYGVAGWINAVWCVIAEDCSDSGNEIQPQSMSISTGSGSELVSFTDTTPSTVYIRNMLVGGTTPTGGAGGGFE